MKTIYPLLIIASLLFASCLSPQKALRNGMYNIAIEKSVKKLRRNPHKDKHILTLEEAYKKANEQDNERIVYLKKEGRPSNYDEIFSIYSGMKYRQDLLKPLPTLTIKSQNNRKAEFTYVNYDDDLLVSKQKAAEYFYSCGVTELNQGDRYSARSAYNNFIEVKKYYADFKDVNTLINRALIKGQTHVLLKVLNKTNSVLPPGFEDELLKMGVSELDAQWIKFDNAFQDTYKYNYYILLTLKGINVMPEQVRETKYTESKEIQEGFDYVLDSKGNVKKDSLGNDIKKPHFKIISCNILETHQHKAAQVNGTLEYIDVPTNQVLRSDPIGAETNFDNFFATAFGNINALKPETKAKMNSRFVPFPTSEGLILQSAQTLKNNTKTIVWNNKSFLQ